MHPLSSLDSTLIVEPCPEGPKGSHKQPHWVLFRATLALDSVPLWTDTVDGGWTHNSNALAGAKRRLVLAYLFRRVFWTCFGTWLTEKVEYRSMVSAVGPTILNYTHETTAERLSTLGTCHVLSQWINTTTASEHFWRYFCCLEFCWGATYFHANRAVAFLLFPKAKALKYFVISLQSKYRVTHPSLWCFCMKRQGVDTRTASWYQQASVLFMR